MLTAPIDVAAAASGDPRRRSWLAVALLVGAALGPTDLLLQRVLPYPFANLANSPALWALVAFGVGWAVRSVGRGRPAAAGVLGLVLAVEGYYASAVLVLGDDPATLADRTALVWLVLAVVAGTVFGTAGAWAGAARGRLGVLGTAAAVGVLLTEAWLDLERLSGAADDPARRQDLVQTALALLVLAALAVVLAGRSATQRVGGLAVALPVALVGALAYGAAGLV